MISRVHVLGFVCVARQAHFMLLALDWGDECALSLYLAIGGRMSGDLS